MMQSLQIYGVVALYSILCLLAVIITSLSLRLIIGLPFDNRDMKRQLEKIVISDFIFPTTIHGKPARKVSKHAKNLITAILNTNPRKRPTIQAILKSKWVQDAAESDSEDEFIENGSSNALNFSFKSISEEQFQREEFVPNGFVVPF